MVKQRAERSSSCAAQTQVDYQQKRVGLPVVQVQHANTASRASVIRVFIAQRVASLSVCQSEQRAWKSANTAGKKEQEQEAGRGDGFLLRNVDELEPEQVRL